MLPNQYPSERKELIPRTPDQTLDLTPWIPPQNRAYLGAYLGPIWGLNMASFPCLSGRWPSGHTRLIGVHPMGRVTIPSSNHPTPSPKGAPKRAPKQAPTGAGYRG